MVQGQNDNGRSDVSPTRVLLCDDTEDIRLLLSMQLRFDPQLELVGVAENGLEAVSLAEELKPDAVILDIAMPVMDGLEALPRIKEAVPGVKVLILSGFEAGQMAEKAMELGADDYVEKGVNAEIVDTLRSLMGLPTGASSDAAPVDVSEAIPKGDPTSVARHELTQPLAGALGFAHLLAEDPEGLSEVDRATAVSAILRNLEQLQSLIKGLEVEGPQETIELELTTVDLSELVQDSAADFKVRHPSQLVECHCDSALLVDVDHVRIRQVLSNLLANAGKFSPPLHPIRITAQESDGRALVTVVDEGPGFLPEESEKIFEKSVRLNDHAPGLGLGLYIARGIVEAHEGRIWAESRPGEGATFSFTLPLALRTEVPAPAPPEGESEKRDVVLIAEDDEDIARLIQLNLQPHGYDVVTAPDGQHLLSIVNDVLPDLVLLDVMMPKIDGFEVCRRLKADARTKHIPVIMLTARSLQADKVIGLTAGADDYLIKPFDGTELALRVTSSIRRGREMRATSPLTQLPGNIQIQDELKHRTAAEEPFALMYIDLDNFKAFNDHYGFLRGDEAIKLMAKCSGEIIQKHSPSTGFLGHVGGDDFVAIVDASVAEQVAKEMIRCWDGLVPRLYDELDVANGYIEVTDRRNELRRFPLMSVSIGIATNSQGQIRTHWEASEIASEMKHFAKSREGSTYALDRRRSLNRSI